MKILLLVLLSFSCINALAEVNKWVDENGRVHYSDQLPPSNAKKVLSSASKARTSAETGNTTESGNAADSGNSDEPKTIAEREADLRKKQKADKEAAEKAARNKASKEANQENCNRAEQSLRELQSGMRIMELDAKGERVYLDEEQRQQRIAKTQQDISTLCK